MIRHILKKDFRLFWHFAGVIALLNFGYAVLLLLNPTLTIENYGSGGASALRTLLEGALVLGGASLVAMIVHEDAIPTVRQDWLTRPIPRWHLLAAKLMSVVVMVHVPMLAADLLYGLMSGNSVGTSLQVALSRNLFVLAIVSLPLLAFSSLTRNLMELIVGSLLLVLTLVGLLTVRREFYWDFHGLEYAYSTGSKWVPWSAAYLVLLLGAIVVLVIQYSWRKTFLSRVLAAAIFGVFWLVTIAIPWNAAFAVDQSLAAQPGSGSAVTLAFDPSVGKYQHSPKFGDEWGGIIHLPVRVDGLPVDAVLRVDLSDTYAIDASGNRKHFSVDHSQDFFENGPAHLRITMDPLSRDGMARPINDPLLKSAPFRLELELSMTLLGLAASYEAQSMADLAEVRGVKCPYRERGLTEGDDLNESMAYVMCSPVLEPPTCVALLLKDLPTPLVLRRSLTCGQDYGPYAGRLRPGGKGVYAVAHLRDPNGTVRFPEGPMWKDFQDNAPAALQFYEPIDHFTRKVVTSAMQLNDWTAVQLGDSR
jgi:hypothetical protein